LDETNQMNQTDKIDQMNQTNLLSMQATTCEFYPQLITMASSVLQEFRYEKDLAQ